MQPGTSPTQGALPRRLYSGRALTLLSGGYAAGLLLVLCDPATYSATSDTAGNGSSPGVLSGIGVFIMLCIVVAICVLDWRGATSLNGYIKWRSMRAWQQWILGYFLIGLSVFLVPIYLIQAFNTYRHAKQIEPELRKRKVAQLEADLGILPATEGTCRECGKSLQVGAEFCSYCGASICAKPLVCPVCSTTALPDARFCPKCRAPLQTRF